jgi:phytoene desaturase
MVTSCAARRKKRWTDKRLNRSRWSMGLFVWYFGTKGTRGKWADVGHHTILNGPRYRGLLHDIFMRKHLAHDMSVYLHRPSVTDPSVAPEGDDTFYALSPVPNLHGDDPVDWAEMADEYRRNLANVLEQNLIPGFEAHLSASETFTPDTFVSRYLSPHGAGSASSRASSRARGSGRTTSRKRWRTSTSWARARIRARASPRS